MTLFYAFLIHFTFISNFSTKQNNEKIYISAEDAVHDILQALFDDEETDGIDGEDDLDDLNENENEVIS